jgi:hypothetical protein
MQKIATTLIQWGMDFDYEHRGSQGEEIRCFQLDVNVKTWQGNIHFTHEGETQKFDEDKIPWDYICALIERIAIEETT